MSENGIKSEIHDDAELARQERIAEQARYLARRDREKARIRVKLENLVGLIDRLAHERDEIQRTHTRARLVEAFENLAYEGPGPDPEETP